VDKTTKVLSFFWHKR